MLNVLWRAVRNASAGSMRIVVCAPWRLPCWWQEAWHQWSDGVHLWSQLSCLHFHRLESETILTSSHTGCDQVQVVYDRLSIFLVQPISLFCAIPIMKVQSRMKTYKRYPMTCLWLLWVPLPPKYGGVKHWAAHELVSGASTHIYHNKQVLDCSLGL